MAQWEFVEWLMFWILETSHFEFEWDKGNQSKKNMASRSKKLKPCFDLGQLFL
jgi:hypothetical protein